MGTFLCIFMRKLMFSLMKIVMDILNKIALRECKHLKQEIQATFICRYFDMKQYFVAWIYFCRLGGTVSCAYPVKINVTISTSTLQTFRS